MLMISTQQKRHVSKQGCMLLVYLRRTNNCKWYVIIYNIMKEQNQSPEGRFTIERFSSKGPFYLQPHQRVAHLQNKVTFYEGQIDPLHSENTHIKQNHMNLARIVSISTEILRNLLPIGNSPAKKLKLEMATIDEIAKMIESDWRDMEQAIASLQTDKKRMSEEIEDWKQRLQTESQCRVREVNQLQNSMHKLRCQLQTQIETLQQKLRKAHDDLQRQRDQALNEQVLRDKIIESCNKELQLFKHESRCKQNDYERCITRLKTQMEANLAEFEEGKKMVKQICQKMMNDKLAELAEAYEMMLKAKEEEKFNLQLSISDMTEEHGKRLQEKEDTIQMLTNQNQSKKFEIKRLEDDLYSKKQELMREIKDNKELQTQLLRANEKNQAFIERIRKQEATICQQAEKIKITIEQCEQNMKLLKDSGAQAMNQMLQEKKKLLAEVEEKEKYIATIIETLTSIEGACKQQLQMAKKKWLEKQSQYTVQITKANKRIQEQKERTKRMKQERERQVTNLGKEHEQLVRRLQRQLKQNKESYVRDYTAKMRQLMDENEEELVKAKLKLKKQFEGEMYKMEEQMKRKTIEFQLKIQENQKSLQSQRRKFQQQINIIKVQEKLLNEQLANAKQQTLDRESQMQKLKIEQIKALKKLQLQNEMNNKKLQEMMEQQMQSFLKELQEKELKISNLQEKNKQDRQQFEKKLNSKDAELVSMKEHMQKEINALKDTNAIGEMEKMYKLQLAALESSLKARLFETQQSYQKQIDSINERNERLMKSMIQDYDRQLNDAHNSFQKALGGLALQFKKRSTFFNDKYLSEEMEVNPQLLSQEEKINFIQQRMQETVKLLLDRDNEIANLNQKIQRFEIKFEQEMAIRRKELDIEKSILIKDCNNKISMKEEQCRLRISEIEKQRKEFSDQMFSQFKVMRDNHIRQFQSLERRYKQLEKLFSERPSRAEDVTKIKELISIQTNLDQEIIIYHKKMETANEIVKYLNLQLENYKETFDIFGPNEHSYNKTISFTDDSHKMMELYKQREQERVKGERQVIHLDKRNAESPDIKQLRIFPEKEDEKSESLIIESKEVMGRSRKYSFVPDKLPPPRERFKTEKITDRQTELMGHAETFMKLIKKTTQDVSIIRELENNEDIKKKTYRRRKLKRLATGVVEHYF